MGKEKRKNDADTKEKCAGIAMGSLLRNYYTGSRSLDVGVILSVIPLWFLRSLN